MPQTKTKTKSPREEATKRRSQATKSARSHKEGASKPRKSEKKRGTKQRAKKLHNIDLGSRGEDAAARFLAKRGFSILERNWKCFAGEADIIALDDEAIHFIEVKTRMGEGSGFPAEAVNAQKRRRYEQIAELYLNTYDGEDTGVTFDVISINVLENDRALLRLYRNVLGCDCRGL